MGNMRFKVGDRVRIKNFDWFRNEGANMVVVYMTKYYGEVVTIKSINNGFYRIKEDGGQYCWIDEMFECKMEEETKPNIIEEAKTYWDSIKDAWICPEGYIFKDENGNEIRTSKIILEKKKKEYPKTYEECCDVLGLNTVDNDTLGMTVDVPMHYSPLIINFTKLLICRDAYWKLYGEEMGLGKPWEPSGHEDCFVISRSCGEVFLFESAGDSEPFEFPTREMRDAFYENFKELIESCKELL